MCLVVCMHMHTVPTNTSRRHQIPWNRRDRLLGASMWALGTQPWGSNPGLLQEQTALLVTELSLPFYTNLLFIGPESIFT